MLKLAHVSTSTALVRCRRYATPVPVHYTRYLKHYYESAQDTTLTLYDDGLFEESTDDDGIVILVGDWELDDSSELKAIVLRWVGHERRYEQTLGPELPLMAASGIEPDTGKDARLYFMGRSDDDKPSDS